MTWVLVSLCSQTTKAPPEPSGTIEGMDCALSEGLIAAPLRTQRDSAARAPTMVRVTAERAAHGRRVQPRRGFMDLSAGGIGGFDDLKAYCRRDDDSIASDARRRAPSPRPPCHASRGPSHAGTGRQVASPGHIREVTGNE